MVLSFFRFARRWPTGKKVLACLVMIILVVLASKSIPVFDSRLPGNDDLMRLQQVRDLMAGQDWFDVDQKRLLTPEGGQIHWSRLPDIFPAILVFVTRPVIGPTHAETLALIAWPLILAFATMCVLTIAMRRLGIGLAGQCAGLLLFAMGGSTHAFLPGRIDHHNMVIVLVITAFVALLKRPANAVSGIIAAACLVAALSIALESLPYVFALIVVAGMFQVTGGARESVRLRAFGFGLAGFAFLFYFGDAPGWSGRRNVCDAYGYSHLVGLVMAGAWLALLAVSGRHFHRWTTRMLLACAGGALTLIVVIVANPPCLGDPYVGVSEQLRRVWLDAVGEARNLFVLWHFAPDMAVRKIGFAVSGLLAAGLIFWRAPAHLRSGRAVLGFLMLVSGLVTLWQIRAAMFAHIFAVIAFAGLIDWLAGNWWRKRGTGPVLVLSGVALVFSPVGWGGLSRLVADDETVQKISHGVSCKDPATYAALARRTPMLVLTPIDLGTSVLALTPHSVFAAPYHRNIEGLEQVIDVFMGKTETAQAKILAMGADHLLYCRGMNETARYALLQGRSFAADMEEGQVPDWLEPVDGKTGTMGTATLYRVRSLHFDGKRH